MNATSALKVLVVDDDRDTTECMQLLLKHLGHDVRTANDGRLALEQAPQFRPDLMLVDLAMPHFDGLAVARGVRQRPELHTTSLVCLSGYGDKAHQDLAFEAGFDECLLKPLPAGDLQELLRRVRDRIDAALELAEQARAVAAETHELTKRSRGSMETYRTWRASKVDRIDARTETSGQYEIVSAPNRLQADELRSWLRHHDCRVGPLFDRPDARVAFFAYASRERVLPILARHPSCQIEP
ncbi:MAG TPA: response regulator [Pirellulales bacterium]|nr:response regulator [Pirellulales bacterium]